MRVPAALAPGHCRGLFGWIGCWSLHVQSAGKEGAVGRSPCCHLRACPIDRLPPRPASAATWPRDTLRALDIPYIAPQSGASFRGLHDSLVNHLGNERPAMLLCLHEEHAVAIAHGWAKVTGRAMAAAVHSNVGLMHATMAVFNAWCDRMPVLLIGATGPVDADKRRPWIDWIHTARDQGALIRGYAKWDDQPASPAAAREALVRAKWIAETAPQGPVYVNLDAGMQEAELAAPLPPLDVARARRLRRARRPIPTSSAAPPPRWPAPKRPVVLAGRGSRTLGSLGAARGAGRAHRRARHHRPQARRRLPDRPSPARGHARHLARCRCQRGALKGPTSSSASIGSISGGTIKAVFGTAGPPAKVIHASLDHRLHGGWSMDYQALPPVDMLLAAEPDAVVGALLDALQARPSKPKAEPRPFAVDGRSAGHSAYRAAGPRAAPRRGGTRGLPAPPAAVLGRQAVAVPASARLHRPGWRRRHRRGPGHLGRRRAGLARQRTPAHRHLRRRRLPDGRDGHLDGRALPASRC